MEKIFQFIKNPLFNTIPKSRKGVEKRLLQLSKKVNAPTVEKRSVTTTVGNVHTEEFYGRNFSFSQRR